MLYEKDGGDENKKLNKRSIKTFLKKNVILKVVVCVHTYFHSC